MHFGIIWAELRSKTRIKLGKQSTAKIGENFRKQRRGGFASEQTKYDRHHLHSRPDAEHRPNC